MSAQHRSMRRFSAVLISGALASKLLGFAREVMMAHVLGASLVADGFRAAIAAVLCFNFFFLPPTGTFTIADPQNWIALVAFLATSIVASQLSGRARQRGPSRRGR